MVEDRIDARTAQLSGVYLTRIMLQANLTLISEWHNTGWRTNSALFGFGKWWKRAGTKRFQIQIVCVDVI